MARGTRARPRTALRRVRWAPVVVLALAWSALLPAAGAVFTDTTPADAGLAAASDFPTYPEAVTGDAPWAYYRLEDAASSAAAPNATDSSGNTRTGTVDGATDGPTTLWHLDEGSGTTARDSSGVVNPGTVSGATWTTGHDGAGLAFNGSSAYVSASAAVTTTESFSVSAWANLTAKGTERNVVSQEGTNVSGFGLHYYAGPDRWAFTMPSANSTGSGVVQAIGSVSPVLGRWYHLVGVYDATAHQLRLYVDGTLQATTAFTATWQATGPLNVGRARWGAPYAYFAGSIDEVRTYRRALSAAEVAALAGDQLRTQWDFSEGSGTSTADSSITGNTGTVNAATWTASGHSGNALAFDGATTSVTGTAPIDTTNSYTVTAWVYVTSSGSYQTAVGIDGTDISGFFLQYDGWYHAWAIAAHASDSRFATSVRALSAAGADLNRWYHLAGVYDKVAQTLRLYVDGVYQSEVAYTSAWSATGPLSVGRGRYDAADRDQWNGMIDGVRLYQRALSYAEIQTVMADSAVSVGIDEATATAGVTGALQGPLSGLTATTGAAFGGIGSASYAASTAAPTAFTMETWFKVGAGQGGALVGFAPDATSFASSSDRALYLDPLGRVVVGLDLPSPVILTSAGGHDDGAWHHAAASVGADGTRLYVDGVLVASEPGTTAAPAGTGYWRWAGLPLTAFTGTSGSDLLVGSLDEVAVFTRQLSDSEIAEHAAANR